MCRPVAVLALTLGMGSLLYGQAGTILGSVKDQSDAVLPGTTVTATNVDTGIARNTVTGARGEFRIPALPAGSYDLQAGMVGFQTEVRKGITLSVGQEAPVNFTLQVGNVAESVTITGEVPMIETTTATVSGLVDPQQMRDIPLNARSFLELVPLQAGAIFAENADSSATKGFGKKLAVNGTRYTSNSFLLDGADINDASESAGGANGSLAGVETVREFRVITNAFDAEYGRHTGAVISAITKSGTNQLHGSVFEFLRNDKLDAPRWEDNLFSAGNKPAFKRNQFGFSAGGPILRDKTFFFGSFEALRENLGLSKAPYAVPGIQMRAGILPLPQSQCADAITGQVITETTANQCPVPVDPRVKPYIDSFPLPNVVQTNGTLDKSDGTAQWSLGSYTQPTTDNLVTARVDHTFSNSDSLFARFTLDNTTVLKGGGTSFNTDESDFTKSRFTTLGETHIFSPALLSKSLLSFNRTNIAIFDVSRPESTFPETSFTTSTAKGSFAVTGLASWGGGATNPKDHIQNIWQVAQDLYYTAGRHSIKFGGQLERFQLNQVSDARSAGTFSFDSPINFMLDHPTDATFVRPGSDVIRGYRESLTGLYIQDDISVTERLKLNLGVRYEFTSTPYEVNGKMATIRNVSEQYRWFVSTVNNTDVGAPMILNPSLKNFAPRVGFAWDISGKGTTSLRAGAGEFYDQILPQNLLTWGVRMPPFFANSFLTAANGTTYVPIDFPNAFFTQPGLISGALPGGATRAEGLEWNLHQPIVYKWSLSIQHQVLRNLSVDVGYVGTRGVHLGRGPQMLNATPSNPTAIDTDGSVRRFIISGLPLPNPQWSWMRWTMMDGTSTYHALQLTVNKRFSQGLQMQTAYTYSKTTDDGSTWNGSTDFGSDIRCYGVTKCHALSIFDFRNNFSTNFTYDLPGKKLSGFAGTLLAGWQASSIIRLNSGSPMTPSASRATPQFTNPITGAKTATAQTNVDGPTLDLIPGGNANATSGTSIGCAGSGISTGTPLGGADPRGAGLLYFDPCQFTFPVSITGSVATQVGQFQGNLGRNVMISPGLANMDITFTKETKVRWLGEAGGVQFRTELYNLLNHPNFSNPATSVYKYTTASNVASFSTNAGLITSTKGTSRQLQFGLKVIF